MNWAELTQEQKCAVALAAEESDLSALLIAWNRYHGKSSRGTNIDQLSRAILALVDARLLDVFPSKEPPAEQPLSREEVALKIANPGAWLEPRDDLVWLVLSVPGNALLAGADPTELTTIYGG